MAIFTAFCRGSDGTGTTWISSIEAESADAAMEAAINECADDWECSPEDVECIGLAEGDVKILFWEDGE